jgi:hypothetical protein
LSAATTGMRRTCCHSMSAMTSSTPASTDTVCSGAV